MTEVVSVRFKNKGKVYYFDPSGLKIPTGADIIVETSKGLEYAGCTWGNHMVEDSALVPPLRPVIRIATDEDTRRNRENREREQQAFRVCQEKIAKHSIDMKLVDVEYNFEGTKILFFFTSDGRVDFRELVKDLAAVFKTRIELRQIGVRDEARMLGGLGICGKPFCCSQFLDEFHPVSIKMAKTQGLSLNPAKISGTCGRLMCCLKYEQNAYEDIVDKAPKNDAFVDTPNGKGSVVSVNLLRGYAKVKLEDMGDTTLKTYTFDQIKVLGGKARRNEYLAAKAEGRLEEAGFSQTPPELIAKSTPDLTLKPYTPQEDDTPFVFADGTVAVARSHQEDAPPRPQPKQGKRGDRQQQQYRGKKGSKEGRPQGGDVSSHNTRAAQPSPQGERPANTGKNNKRRRPNKRHSKGGGGQKPVETNNKTE